jgi:hypothetical protein
MCIVIPHAFGLNFARNGYNISNRKRTSSYFFANLDLPPYIFLLTGYLVAFGLVLTILMALLYRHSPWRYILLPFLGITQFLTGLAYTRQNFQNPTAVVYGPQAYKVNLIDIGIIFALSCVVSMIVLTVILLTLKRKFTGLNKLLSKKLAVISMIALGVLTYAVASSPYVLELLGGVAP